MNDPSARLAAALADRYRIERELGAGGMATVYLAQDLRHDRRVALKVLRPELAAVLGAERFVQEIKTTAALQHPHILPLFDSGRTRAEGSPDEFLYYVMPYIEGETLRGRLNRETQLGIDEAIRITTDVADALDYAHRQGVIHRDIKPENILLHDGRPMVADFGIALAVSAAAGGRMTETGLSLGTPHYMSPEQATAEKEITARSDIYSLASVLYEMLSGNPPHVGASAQQTIMKIVTEDAAPVTTLRKAVPPNVAAALTKALEKLPADRFDSAKAFAEALVNPGFTTPTTALTGGAARPRPRWSRLTAALGALALVATVTSVWGWVRLAASSPERPAVEFYLDPPDSAMALADYALSPDGQRLVAAFDSDSGRTMYERALDQRAWRIVPSTAGGSSPFFSPDGEWLGFITPDGTIKRVPVQGGTAQSIHRIDGDQFGVAWGPGNSVIVAAASTDASSGPSLFRVTPDGGAPERLATPPSDGWGLVNPNVMVDENVVLFTQVSQTGTPTLSALSLTTGRSAQLVPGMSPRHDRRGHVVYVTPDGVAMMQKFDPASLTLQGQPRRVAENIAIYFGVFASYSLSTNGSMVFEARSGEGNALQLVDRSGAVRSRLLVARPGFSIAHPRFSPSGDRLAYVSSAGTDRGDVWVYSIAQGTTQRLSFEGLAADPAWSPDGRWIGYSAVGPDSGALAALYLRASDGTGRAREILRGDDHLWQMDFGSRADEIVFRSGNDLYRAAIGIDSQPVPLLETAVYEEHPTLSPDGRWLAYKSNETGQDEVYVRSYPDMGPRTVVSIGGGRAPAWSSTGRELFYVGRFRMTVAALRLDGSTPVVTGRTDLFRLDPYVPAANRNYDVHPDDQRFAIVAGQRTRMVWRVDALKDEKP